LRLLLIAGNIAVLRTPYATFGSTKFLLFDVGGALGIAGMGVALVWSIVKHAGQLYQAERVT
jgi:archaetidylinositol phosphate synthase